MLTISKEEKYKVILVSSRGGPQVATHGGFHIFQTIG
jgi:hypothetical protein